MGIHNRQQKNLEYNESSIYSDNPYYDSLQIINSIDQEQIFYFGIIDILTNFSTKKKIEYLSKRIYYGPTISAIPPLDYSIRFYDFMNKNLFAWIPNFNHTSSYKADRLPLIFMIDFSKTHPTSRNLPSHLHFNLPT